MNNFRGELASIPAITNALVVRYLLAAVQMPRRSLDGSHEMCFTGRSCNNTHAALFTQVSHTYTALGYLNEICLRDFDPIMIMFDDENKTSFRVTKPMCRLIQKRWSYGTFWLVCKCRGGHWMGPTRCASQVARATTHAALFTQVSHTYTALGYFDPVNVILDDENKTIFGVT